MRKIPAIIFIIIVILFLVSCAGGVGNSSYESPDLPDMEVKGEATTPVIFLTAVNIDNHYFLLDIDKTGKIIRMDEKEGDLSNVDGFRTSYFPSEDGKFRFYFETIADKANRFAQSEMIVFDKTQEKKIQYLLDGMYFPVDSHDAIVFSDEHFIISTSVPEDTADHGRSFITRIQEIKNDDILWEFNSSNYPSTFVSRIYDGDINTTELEEFNDLIHVNSMYIDPVDGNLLVSARNQCCIYKIDRSNGKRIWTFGGQEDEFGLDESEAFHFQHSVSITKSGNLLLYDNGFMKEDSRVLEFRLDEANRTYELISELKLPYHSWTYGAVEELSDKSYLIQRGNTGQGEVDAGFCEVDKKTGEEYFSVTFEKDAESYWTSFTTEKW